MPTTHCLKTWPHEHDAVADGTKTFEVRGNKDRSFGVGDTLLLQRWDPGALYNTSPGAYIGDAGFPVSYDYEAHTLRMRVTYILHGGRFGLPDGICVMGITPILETD